VLKPASSYLVPNPKYHHAKSSANSSVTPALDSEAHQTSTVNSVYEYSEEINAQAEHDFSERRRHLWEVCERSKVIGKFSPNAWEFFISPGHGLAWCNVFKAASTTWMYYFNILGELSS
jgi:chondroitin 4-sulfotransferase 11